MTAFLIVFTGLLGLLIGSFLNVVAYRVPRGESLVTPASHCPSCEHPIRPWHNVPVLGWLLLRGRCADCGTRISPRYPLVELGTGVAFAAVAARLLQLDLGSAVPAYLYFTAVGIALALIDLDCRRLPNALVLPSYPVLARAARGLGVVAARLVVAGPRRHRRRRRCSRSTSWSRSSSRRRWASGT